jgi:hypothetical protein
MADSSDSSKSINENEESLDNQTGKDSVESDDDQRTPQADQTSHVAAESLARAHEVQEVNLWAIVRFAVVLLVALLVIHFVLWGLIGIEADQPPVPRIQLQPAQVTPEAAPGPGIEAQPALDRAAALAPAYAHIATYGWVDKDGDKVHLPVDRAMQLLMQRGLSARTEGKPPTFALPPAYTLDSTGGQISAQDLQPK